MEKIVMREYKSNSQSAMSVIEEMRKKEAKREGVQERVRVMLGKAIKGDLSGVKGKVGSSEIPKEALGLMTGLPENSEGTKIKIDTLN